MRVYCALYSNENESQRDLFSDFINVYADDQAMARKSVADISSERNVQFRDK